MDKVKLGSIFYPQMRILASRDTKCFRVTWAGALFMILGCTDVPTTGKYQAAIHTQNCWSEQQACSCSFANSQAKLCIAVFESEIPLSKMYDQHLKQIDLKTLKCLVRFGFQLSQHCCPRPNLKLVVTRSHLNFLSFIIDQLC